MKCPADKSGKCTERMCSYAMCCQRIQHFKQGKDMLDTQALIQLGLKEHFVYELVNKLQVYGYTIVRKELVK